MVDEYLGAVKLFAGNFAITGFAFCAGQLLSIQQNTALFSILGTTYGGNGVQTFNCRTCAAGCRSARATAKACRRA